MVWTKFRLLAIPAALVALAQTRHAADHYAVSYERNVPVKMRDGFILRIDIYRPADAKFRALL